MNPKNEAETKPRFYKNERLTLYIKNNKNQWKIIVFMNPKRKKEKKKTFIIQPNGHQARLVMQVQPNQS